MYYCFPYNAVADTAGNFVELIYIHNIAGISFFVEKYVKVWYYLEKQSNFYS